MTKIYNITQLRKAKKFYKELTDLLPILIDTKNKLDKFKIYNPAKEVLKSLDNEIVHVKIYIQNMEKIIQNKGELDGDTKRKNRIK